MDQKRRVVLVDDDDTERLLLRTRLEQLGLQVDAFGLTTEALAHLKTLEGGSLEAVALVTDVECPPIDGKCLDGLWLLAQVRAHEVMKGLVVVVISGEEKHRFRARALQAAFLQKPFEAQQLYSFLSTLHAVAV